MAYYNAPKFENPKVGDLRVWWIPQVGAKIPTFRTPVKNLREAKLLLEVLANYDLYQLDNKIKPDFANVGGLEVYDNNVDGDGNTGWCSWYDENGNDEDDYDMDGNLKKD